MTRKINILKLFFEGPGREFNVREAARLLKLAPATASKELKDLAKEGLLKAREERMLNLYKANLESDLYRDMKVHYNIRKIKDSGLFDELNRFYLKPTIVLFGSAASGLDAETSDFDILVVSEKTKLMDVKRFEKKVNRPIQLFAVRELKELKNDRLINNVLNGIKLQGRLKWI